MNAARGGPTAVLSLGSNLGDRLGWLRLGVAVLAPYAVSPVYETEPVGALAQPDFLNVVVLASLDAAGAWRLAQRAEREAGRDRAVPHGPRTLDVDVIVADGTEPGLVLPHPRAHERAFVLAPWADLEPSAELPGYGPVQELLGLLDGSGSPRVRLRADLELAP